ncbi:MAG TPA: hypothetical protein VFQ43_09825 [Nitrososphaera sp.]|nr:hypothetical protein [Nitrososphaera sp.]
MSEKSQSRSWQEVAAEAGAERNSKRRAELWRELEEILDERHKALDERLKVSRKKVPASAIAEVRKVI